MGGLARRASAVAKERASDPNALVLDCGSSLAGNQLADQTQGKVIVEAMGRLGYQAMVVGGSDFALGRDTLLARAKDASFPFVSANLIDATSQQAVLPAYTIVESGGRKIAIVGLTGPADLIPGGSVTLKVGDPISTLRDTVGQLRGSASAIIVLAHVGGEWDQRIASEVPGIAAVVAGGQYSPDASPWISPQTGTVVVHPGAQGEYLGVLRLRIDGESRVVSNTWSALPLDKSYVEDQVMRDLVNSYAGQR